MTAVPAFDVWLGPALRSEAALRDLQQLWSGLRGLSRHFGFEVRIGPEGSDDVDLGFAVTQGEASAFARFARGRCAATSESAAWPALASFAEQWVEHSELAPWVPFIGLEFDRAAAAQSVASPSVFVAMDAPLEPDSGRSASATWRQVLGLLAAQQPPRAALQRVQWLEQCSAALPASGRLLHLGVMLGRPEAAIRVSVGVPARGAQTYLADIGWAGDRELLDAQLRWAEPRARDVQLDFDVCGGIGARLGVGIRVQRDRWAGFLDGLVEAGWCCAERRRAVLEWIAPATARAHPETGGYARYISHVKLVSGAPAEAAKCYLGAIGAKGAQA